MRLYLNDKEARFIQTVLSITHTMLSPEQQAINNRILDRLEISLQLQRSENRSKEEQT